MRSRIRSAGTEAVGAVAGGAESEVVGIFYSELGSQTEQVYFSKPRIDSGACKIVYAKGFSGHRV